MNASFLHSIFVFNLDPHFSEWGFFIAYKSMSCIFKVTKFIASRYIWLMKRLVFILSVSILASCSPIKSSDISHIDVYCDSCFIKVSNELDDFNIIEYNGTISNYARIDYNKFVSEKGCVRIIEKVNYSNDDIVIYFITNNDTTSIETGELVGFCH